MGSGEAMELMMEGGGREAVLRAYDELLLTLPELPRQLRDFQVACAAYWGLLCVLEGGPSSLCSKLLWMPSAKPPEPPTAEKP